MASLEKKPNITQKKAQNAIKKYCPSEFEIEYDDILILIDDTVFGSGKDGLLVTKDYICGREYLSEPFYIETDDIEEIEFKKGATLGTDVFVNGEKVIHLATDYGNIDISGDTLLQMILQAKDNDDEYEDDEEYLDEEEYEEEYDDEEDEIELLHIIEEDELIQSLKTSIVVDKGFGAAAVAADLFSNFILKIDTNFSGKSNEQELKYGVKKGIIKITSLLRDNVDRLELYELQNDVATIEFVLYASFLIHKEFVDRGFPEETAFEFIKMTMFDIFKQNTRYFIPILKEICLDIDSHEEAGLNFMMRLYFTNKVGHTLPADFTEGVDMNEVASSIKAYATNKGFIKEIDNVVTGVAKCMNDLGVIDILDDSILNEAYKCVDELC